MNNKTFNVISENEFLGFMSQLVDQTISENDFQRLSDELKINEALRLQFVQYMAMHSQLHSMMDDDQEIDAEHVAQELETLLQSARPDLVPISVLNSPTENTPAERDQSGSHRKRRRTSWVPYIGMVASLLISASFGYFVVQSQQSDPVATSNPQRVFPRVIDQEAVAIVSQMIDVQWRKDDEGFFNGAMLKPGHIEFVSGLVQIDFFCGATMIVEGPASFNIVDSKKGYVYEGSLRVNVPEHARGFTIESAKYDVEDLGTEFGMNVNAAGDAEIHVIEGEVKVRSADDASDDGANGGQLLTEGEALQLSNTGDRKAIATQANRFAGPLQLSDKLAESQSLRFQRWQEMMDDVRKDPATVALYTFPAKNESVKWDRTLADISNNAANGNVVGCQWREGRWSNKRALKYSNSGDRVQVNIPGTYEAVTMATWINLDSFGSTPNRKIALTNPSTEQNESLEWTMETSKRGAVINLAVTDSVIGFKQHTEYSSQGTVMVPSDLGRWIHLAVTYDPVNKSVTHYRNGKKFVSRSIGWTQKIGLGVANIGNRPGQQPNGKTFEVRNMDGLMDEFLVSSRAFTADEIAELYETGR